MGFVNGMKFTMLSCGLDPREPAIPSFTGRGNKHRLSFSPLYLLVMFDDVECLQGRRLTVVLPGSVDPVTLDLGVVVLFPSACQPFPLDVFAVKPDLVHDRILEPLYDIVRVGFPFSLAYASSDYKIQGEGLAMALVQLNKVTGKDKVC